MASVSAVNVDTASSTSTRNSAIPAASRVSARHGSSHSAANGVTHSARASRFAVITTKTVSFSPYRAQFVNLTDRATARGLEASLDIAPVRTLRIAAGYTYVDADAALRRPAHSGFARASWTPARGSLDVDVRKVGVRADNDFSSLSPSLLESGGEWVWNAAASVRLGARVEAVGRVENAFDRQYMEPLGYPAWGRVWHGGLRVRF